MNKILCIAALTLFVAAFLAVTHQPNPRQGYDLWKLKFGKDTQSSHDDYRFKVYSDNLKKISAHNADPNQTYQMGENQFLDLTFEEFAARMLNSEKIEASGPYQRPQGQVNDSVDWSAYGKVKNQGQCASGWALATTSAVEALFAIRGSTVVELSEQQLIDCERQSHGCSGGWVQYALQYIKENGIATSAEYPYRGNQGICKQKGGAYKIGRYSTLKGHDDFLGAINFAPVISLLDADSWQFYQSGIMYDCIANRPTHYALIVGLDDQGVWKVRNSWGTTWGEAGYIRLGPGNTCGIWNEGYQPSLFW